MKPASLQRLRVFLCFWYWPLPCKPAIFPLFRRDRRNEHDSLRNAAPFFQSDHSLRDGNQDRLVAAQRRYRCGEGQNVSAPA